MLELVTAVSYLCNRPKQNNLIILLIKCLQDERHFETCGFGLPATTLDGPSGFGVAGQQKTAQPLPVACVRKAS